MNTEPKPKTNSQITRERRTHLYLNAFFNWVTGGRYTMEEDIASIGIKPLGDRILTRHKVTKIWAISGFPYEFDLELIQGLRIQMKERYPNVSLLFQIIVEPVDLKIQSDLFRKQMQSAAQRYEKFNSAFEELVSTDKRMGVSYSNGSGIKLTFTQQDVIDKERIWNSYITASEHVEDGKSVNYCHIFVHAQAPTNKIMNQFAPSFSQKLFGLKLSHTPIKKLMSNYLENYSPVSYITPEAIKYGQSFLFDENIAHILPTKTEGLVNTEGILLGIIIKNGLPMLLEFFKSGQGQTVMLLGQTGWGKTITGFQLCLGLLGDNCHCSIVDLKGDEWNKLGKYTIMKEISLGGTTPCFVNTLRIDDMTFTKLSKQDASEVYTNAVQGTTQVLSILADIQPDEGNISDLNSVLEQAIISYYNDNQVEMTNSSSFIHSRHMNYEGVLPFLSEVRHTVSVPPNVKATCELARYRIDSYLKGVKTAESFKNEITLKEILDSPLVIYSLNKNSDVDLTKDETLKVFMAEFLSTKKHLYRKRLGLQSALFAEEVHRYKKASMIVDFLCNMVTGARSQNVMNVFILNNLDKLSSDDFSAVKNNVTTAIVGKITLPNIETLKSEYNMPEIADNLEKIANDPEKYKYCFCIDFNTGFQYGNAMYRAYMPENMGAHLKTRTTK